MKKILIGTSVRQDEDVFKLYLESLDKLIIPEGYEIHKYFVLHNSEHLKPILFNYIEKEKDKKIMISNYEDDVEYAKDEYTHHWNNSAIRTISLIKNHIMCFAKQFEYDYLFFVDSDLILQPQTLQHLINQQKDIIAEVFWTKWTPDGEEEPNAWDYDVYDFAGSKQNRLAQWREAGVYEIGMTGASILLSRNVLNATNVNYSKISNVNFWGEDRHFCIRASVEGFKIYLDTTYPATHLYRKSDIGKVVSTNG